MRILQRYIIKDYLVSFLLTLGVFTFVMCLAAVIKAVEAAASGVSVEFIVKFFLLNIPALSIYTIPISVLTACLLLFGRLSFDGELTAMKACGMSLWNIIAPVIIMSVGFSMLCVYINISIAPQCKSMSRTVLKDGGMEQLINLLEPGEWVHDFPNLIIRIGSRSGDKVTDVVVIERDAGGLVRDVRAQRGELRSDETNKVLFIDLYGVRIDQRKQKTNDGSSSAQDLIADHYPLKIDFSEDANRPRFKKPSDMTLGELIDSIRDVAVAFPGPQKHDPAQQKMLMVVEVNKRFSMSLACFAFTLIGIPLGMKSRRKESSVGVGLALGLVFLFYLFIIIAYQLIGRPEFRPDLVVWLPVILCEVIGFWLIYRQN